MALCHLWATVVFPPLCALCSASLSRGRDWLALSVQTRCLSTFSLATWLHACRTRCTMTWVYRTWLDTWLLAALRRVYA